MSEREEKFTRGTKDIYYSYRRGWTDGAKATAMSAFDESEAYKRGYSDGYEARKAMSLKASEISGHNPSPLRLAKGPQ